MPNAFFSTITFLECHIVSSIDKNRLMSELVAKKMTISSDDSRTSWQENSCKLIEIEKNYEMVSIYVPDFTTWWKLLTTMHHHWSLCDGIRTLTISWSAAQVLTSSPEFLP